VTTWTGATIGQGSQRAPPKMRV